MRIPGLIAVAIVAYWPTSAALWHLWTDDLFFGGHGLLVAALALWLLVRARERIAAAPVRSQPWALLLLLPGGIALLILQRASIEGLQFLMLPALILLGALAALGAAVTRAIAVPVGFLYFAVPAWNILAAPLQSLTLSVVTRIAPAIGVPAIVSGTLISLPEDMTFNVGLLCSGVGFLVEGLAVAALMGELEQASTGRRVRLLASMVVVAIVTNWVRVLAIVDLGYSTRMRHVLVTRHHLLFGYVLFVLVLVMFVWVARQRAPPDAPPAALPTPRSPGPVPGAYVWALTALAAPPALAVILAAASATAPARELRLPAGRAQWSGPLASEDTAWRPVFVGAHDESRGTYHDLSGHSVEVVAVGYAAQAQDRELVNENNSLVGNAGLTELTSERVNGSGGPFREQVAADEHALRSVIWSFYVIGGHSFVTPLWAQLWYGINAFGTPPYSALFAFRTACVPSCAAARALLADFTQAMRPEVFAARTQGPLPGEDVLPAMLVARPDKH